MTDRGDRPNAGDGNGNSPRKTQRTASTTTSD